MGTGGPGRADRLTESGFYELMALEVCRDGQEDAEETALMERVRRQLSIPKADAGRTLAWAREYARTNPKPGTGPLQPRALFEMAFLLAMTDGAIDPGEERLLRRVGATLGVPAGEIDRVLCGDTVADFSASPEESELVDRSYDGLQALCAQARGGDPSGDAPPRVVVLTPPAAHDEPPEPARLGLLGWFAEALGLDAQARAMAAERRDVAAGMELLHQVLQWLVDHPGARDLHELDDDLARHFATGMRMKHDRLGQAASQGILVGFDRQGLEGARRMLAMDARGAFSAEVAKRSGALALLLNAFYVSEGTYLRLDRQYAALVMLVEEAAAAPGFCLPSNSHRILGHIAEDLRDCGLGALATRLARVLEVRPPH